MKLTGLVLVGLAGAGCSLLPGTEPATPEPDPQSATDCPEPLAFEGETTLAALGLGGIPGIGAEAERRGAIRITADEIPWEAFAPPDVPPAVEAGQMLCVTWPDGSGMALLLAEPFARPGVFPVATGEVPVAPILVAFVVLVLVLGSWFAFRSANRRGT